MLFSNFKYMNLPSQPLEDFQTHQKISPLAETTNRSSSVVRSLLQSIDDYIEEHIDYGPCIENYLNTPQASWEKILYELAQEITRLSKVHINNDFLKAALKVTIHNKGIESLVHCEGNTVMDFVREWLELIKNSTTIREQHKKFYMIVWFFTQYGKTDSKIQEANKIQLENPVDSKGNHDFKYDGYEKVSNLSPEWFRSLMTQLRKNGLTKTNLKLALWLIENHNCEYITDENAFLELSIPLYVSNPRYFKVLFQFVNVYRQSSVTFSITHNLQRLPEIDQSLCDTMIQNINTYLELKWLMSTIPEIQAKQQVLLDAMFHRVKNKDTIQSYRIEHTKMRFTEIAT